MAIGLGMWRATRRGRRVDGVWEDRGGPRATVREVCLIGLDRPSAEEDWPAGREVTWLGRTYQVRASADDGPIDPSGRRYVHLTACVGD
jgi:hypothetical protein